MKQIKLGLIGAGERGANCYAPYALKYPAEARFVCVAEPIAERRERFAQEHNISENMRFQTWEDMLKRNPELDGVIIATQDTEHFEPVMAAIEKGYHILLEKPMAETLEKTEKIVMAANEKGVLVMVCHVLRHTPFFVALKEAIVDGEIGEVKSIHHIERIGYWHFAHSFVRGNWHKAKESTPMIVAKCSHDTDIFNYLLEGKKCKRVSSFGSLSYFNRENMPKGAPENCLEGCPHNKDCMYSAYKYLEDREQHRLLKDIVMRTDDREAFLEHLKESPYSKCVYQCDNDVADHQVVNIEYEDGTTVSFQASAFTADIAREMRITGTRGEIEGWVEEDRFIITDFATGNQKTVEVHTPKTLHAGGDECIMQNFVHALVYPDKENQKLSAELSLQGHVMAFAAEESRENGGKVIDL